MYTGIHTVNIFKVGQNLICTVYIRYYWKGDHQIRGHTRCIHTVLSDIYIKYMYGVRRLFFNFFGRHVYFWGGHPEGNIHPPNPPSRAPTQTERVPICSFLNSAPICILIKTWNWIVAELWGKNGGADARAHMTYQAPTTDLHSPTSLPFLQNFIDYLMLAQSWKFEVKCCFIGLTPPAACTRARVPLTFGRVHRPPLLPNLLKKGGNRLGLS